MSQASFRYPRASREPRRAPLRRCPRVHVADHRIRARVEFVSCRKADRLILDWRRRLSDPHERCIPRNSAFGFCTVDTGRSHASRCRTDTSTR